MSNCCHRPRVRICKHYRNINAFPSFNNCSVCTEFGIREPMTPEQMKTADKVTWVFMAPFIAIAIFFPLAFIGALIGASSK